MQCGHLSNKCINMLFANMFVACFYFHRFKKIIINVKENLLCDQYTLYHVLSTINNTVFHHIEWFSSYMMTAIWLTMSNLFPVCPVFTSSGPVRTTAVFAPAVCLSTAHSSVCLALKKLTPGSGDWSICLQGQTYKDQWAGVSVCTVVFVYFYHC